MDPSEVDERATLRHRVEALSEAAEELAYQAFFAEREAAAQATRADAAEARLDSIRRLFFVRAGVAVRRAALRLARRDRTPDRTGSGAGVSPPRTFDPITVPIVVIVRDRVEPLTRLLTWLEHAGHRNVILVDNASTYPPLRELLATTRHRVVHLERNLGQRSPWIAGVIAEVGHDQRFVVTDPDVVPDDDCPLDAVAHFGRILDAHPEVDKVGFGLRIDDLPASYALADDVRRWEAPYWADEIEPGVFRAPIDTTFALYRSGRWHRLDAALRTGAPYVARHLPWYANTANPTDDERYYRAHLDPSINTWDQRATPERSTRRADA